MIPIQLTLKNFLSYREAVLDFRGLHTACICGANGAGKSSLLEAMTWAIWGKCRATREDDAIHRGADFGRVDFQFICHQQTYRIIRSRTRGKASRLEFQIEGRDRLRSLTGKKIKDTQEKIDRTLKIDYETFINSAYLRQGHADEFMLRTPSRRKDVLVELLKLNRYEALAERAKDRARQYKAEAEQLQASLLAIAERLAARPEIETRQQELEGQRQTLQLKLDCDLARLTQLQVQLQQWQLWQQQLTWQQSQLQSLQQETDRLYRERLACNERLQQLQSQIDRSEEIEREYDRLQTLQKRERAASENFQTYQKLQEERQQVEREFDRRQQQLQLQLQQHKTRLAAIEEQIGSLTIILQQKDEIQSAIAQLDRHRQVLLDLERRQREASPLLNRRQELHALLEVEKAGLAAQIDGLTREIERDRGELAREPQLREGLERLGGELKILDERDRQLKQVEDRGKDCKNHRERLRDRQQLCRDELPEIEDKLRRLAVPDAHCPLCERELDHRHRRGVIDKTQQRLQELQREVRELDTQMADCDRDIAALRNQYKQLQAEVSRREALTQKFIKVETQLDAIAERRQDSQQRQADLANLRGKLETGDYGRDYRQEARKIELTLQSLAYDERAHRQQQAEVERWRWAEIQRAKFDDALARKQQLECKLPQLATELADIERQMQTLHTDSNLQHCRTRLQQDLETLNYEAETHNQLLCDLRQAGHWQGLYRQLQEAIAEYPQKERHLHELESQLSQRTEERAELEPELERICQRLAARADPAKEIANLEQSLQQQRRELDTLLAQQGRIDQSLYQLDELDRERLDIDRRIQEIRRQHRIHNELALAFGKNGIQALMIENALPQLEAEANHILGRLTQNQLHLQFITQKTGKTSRRKAPKYIDTLDIAIADSQGTRPYETYSGGEAFRINFAVRLALAQLLAQQSGIALQMLVIDEGFGTQDSEGCERLVAAINAIAPDFACILAVTHMPQFKEAFQQRIEVCKGDLGSTLQVMN